MANEFRKVTDQNGVDHPVCDDTRVDWSSYSKTGTVNLFDNKLTTSTEQTVDLTVDSDKIIDANGTAADRVFIEIGQFKPSKGGTFYGSGAPGLANTYIIFDKFVNNAHSEYITDSGNGVTITLSDGDFIKVFLDIRKDVVCDHIKFKPMISVNPYATYAPHTMTNRELTEIKDVELTPQTGVTLSADTRLSVTGNMASLSFQATADITASANNRLFNFSTNYKPKAITYGIAIINSATVARIYIDTYGIAWLWGTSALTGATIQGSLTWIING